MKSISKLVLVALLLAASYKMYGQSGFNCTSGPLPPQFLNCEADCQAYVAECQAECSVGSYLSIMCMTYCDESAVDCSNACVIQYCPS